METFEDIAIPLSWPDKTARGDEKWMVLLKKLGLVKNLNFKIGHAAILLIEKVSGRVLYFDFGRYITPRGDGRARSVHSDPRLRIETRAFIGENGILVNLEEILNELSELEFATHGGGKLLCSIATGISFKRSYAFSERLVDQGPIKYGALAPNNNNCSRYVAQILVEGMSSQDPRKGRILYPEFIKASPTSNVVNADSVGQIFCYEDGILTSLKMNRSQSARFHFKQLYTNFTTKGAQSLGDDSQPGHTAEPIRGTKIPKHAQWLGGIGEGRWFVLDGIGAGYQISRLDENGMADYRVICHTDRAFDPELEYSFTFDVHHQRHVISQKEQNFVFQTESRDLSPDLEVHSQLHYRSK